MTKTIKILAITTAIIIGSIATGTIAFADDDDELSSLLCDVGKVMTGIVFGDDDDGATQIFCAEIDVNDADSDPSNEDQTLSGTGEVVLSTTEAGDGGGTVTCADITGGAGLCDGVDAVNDADSSTTNELQSLSETNGKITLSGDGSVQVQDRVTGTCAVGSSIRAIAADGTVTCVAGVTSYYSVLVKQVPSASTVTIRPFCDSGDLATGGGSEAISGNVADLERNLPNPTADGANPAGWIVKFANIPSAAQNTQHSGYVICADFPPLR